MRAKSDDQGKSVRLLRVAEQVRHALADLLARGEVRDDVLAKTIVSVTEVRVSPDLRNATAFIKTLGSKDEQAVLDALKANSRFMRGEVAKRMRTRYTPELTFRADESFDAASKIDAILRSPQVKRDLDPE